MGNSNEHMNAYMKRRYKKRRERAITQLGGSCAVCGTCSNLEIDHVDPSKKDFTLAKASSYSEQRWQAELSKCQLLCSTCHKAKHASTAPCGTAARYWRGCRCEACRRANAAYSRERAAKRRSTTEETP